MLLVDETRVRLKKKRLAKKEANKEANERKWSEMEQERVASMVLEVNTGAFALTCGPWLDP